MISINKNFQRLRLVHWRCSVHNRSWLFLLNRTAFVFNGLSLLILRSPFSIILNDGHKVLLEELVRAFLVDSLGRSLGDIIKGYLRHIEVRVKSFDLTKEFIKPVGVLVAKLLKVAIEVSELRLPVSFSTMDLLP